MKRIVMVLMVLILATSCFAYAEEVNEADSTIEQMKANEISYKVRFDDNGSVTEQIVRSGDSAVQPEVPVKEGKVFCGWWLDND